MDSKGTKKPLWRHLDKASLPKDRLPGSLGSVSLIILALLTTPLLAYIDQYLANKEVVEEEAPFDVEWVEPDVPQEKFVEVTEAMDPEIPPPDSNLIAANNQLAAQEEINEELPEGVLPENSGEVNDSQKVLPDDPIMQELVTSVDIEEALDQLEEPLKELLEDLEQEAQEDQYIEQVEPQPKPRPKIVHPAIAAPMMKSDTSARRVGALGVDARFSEFGAYQQRLLEAVGYRWQLMASQYRYGSNDWNSKVHVRFTLFPDGHISETQVIDTGASHVATLMCKDAIEASAPFGNWSEEMLAKLGDSFTMNFVFYF